ncbi:glycosyltransferase [Kitasatospora atroaurantiaca]|uniref:D-inositol 3-phosphate glycosyltransferase n=1 Tax=Kitasatospora atroaurantiaca TaxID=285545 RepID=A0A561EX34_9ACTN|nr:glycosyltransferase [Kitasatospora atroaurantiaca]TWE20163.1 glycosyltransferase involved in cell wall biosynthesis [Kitasatospora atroaurantiaca]
MRVLHVITGLASGGAERQLLLMLRHLPEHHHCEVATLTNPGTVAAALRAEGVTVHDLAMRGNRDLAVLPRLTRLIRAGGYDLVHTHLYRAGLYGRLAARLAGVRTVLSTEHSLHAGVIEGRPATAGVKALYLAAERLGTTTVAVSRQVAGTLDAWGVPDRRVHLLPNGIEAARYMLPTASRAALRQTVRAELGLPQQAWVVGGVGRLVPGKRFEVLVDAVAGLADLAGQYPALREPWLLLVGAGPEHAALVRRAERLGLAGRLLCTGERDDVPELLTSMDVLAAPSAEETFGLTVLEGLAAGLPVRHSACPALDELGPGAAPEAERIPSDATSYTAALRELWGRRSGALPQPPAVAHYDIARIADELGQLYDRLGPAGTASAGRPPVAARL